MTNRIAFWTGLAIVVFVAYDIYSGTGMVLFLARKFSELVHYVAFWR